MSQAPADILVLLGKGDGTFLPAVGYAAGTYPAAAAVGDFNRDGNLDLAVPDFETNTVSIFLGNGNGTFASPATFPTTTSPAALTIGDFNGDGFQLFCRNQSSFPPLEKLEHCVSRPGIHAEN